MSNELTVRQTDDKNVSVTATNPAQLPHLQQGLVEWSRKRVEIARRESGKKRQERLTRKRSKPDSRQAR